VSTAGEILVIAAVILVLILAVRYLLTRDDR
jgi:hypothetical protein